MSIICCMLSMVSIIGPNVASISGSRARISSMLTTALSKVSVIVPMPSIESNSDRNDQHSGML